MFKAETKNVKQLKSIFIGASNIVDEIQIEIDSDGMRARALDRSHVSFISFDLSVDFFDEFTLTEPETLHVDMDNVVNVLKRSKNNDILTITTDSNNIIFTFTGESKRTFNIKQIDMDYTSPEPPIINTPINKLPIPFNILKDSVTDIEMVTEKINIKVTEDNVIFTGHGNFSDVQTEYLHGERVDTTIDSNYTLEYIKKILQINQVTDTIYLSLGTDTPLLIHLEGLEGEKVEFLLAPRMEEREE